MSANNRVIIRKINNNLYQGFDVDIDAYDAEDNNEYYDNLQPVFESDTLMGVIKAYNKYCAELTEQGMYVEYGLAFEGI